MESIIILGAGKVGHLVSTLLAESQDYHIHLLDLAFSQAVMQYAEKKPNINLHSVDCSQKSALINVITPLDADAVI